MRSLSTESRWLPMRGICLVPFVMFLQGFVSVTQALIVTHWSGPDVTSPAAAGNSQALGELWRHYLQLCARTRWLIPGWGTERMLTYHLVTDAPTLFRE
ncbi:hypothetical protein C8Q77DRAFT_1123761 [Trametes polyzona]|nr:hypothetical protein C8Q77DRAFT_1123761 [Trametes polyzona]